MSNFDDATLNEDWIKTTVWDVPGVNRHPAQTLDELHTVFPDMSDADWRACPAILAAPPAIRQALGV